jgi:site-specific DNA recombinase
MRSQIATRAGRWYPDSSTMTAGSPAATWSVPASKPALLADIDAGQVDVVVVYKVDRLTRSLADFAKIVEAFDASRRASSR